MTDSRSDGPAPTSSTTVTSTTHRVAGEDPTVRLTRRSAAQRPAPPDPAASDTEVLSLDELMDLAAGQRPARPLAPPAAPPVAAVAPPKVAATPAPVPPVSPPATTRRRPPRTARDDLQRISQDASRALRAAADHASAWLRTADNGLITATVAIALLLILAVAAF